MTTSEHVRPDADRTAEPAADLKLEVVVIPVADVDRALAFYHGLGWRLDADVAGPDGRLVQITPPGSDCSVQFGTWLTSAAPGSAQHNYLVVADILAARDDLLRRGAAVSEVFHDKAGGYRFDASSRVSGPDAGRRTYASYATFSDPDGNVWLLQEVTDRKAGRMDPGLTRYASAADLTAALKRAAAAHGAYEARLGQPHADWPEWYAAYMAAEQFGGALPS
jgi:catechol 2,3-dioxygenase-like lactoylglutathione lyase family enzyme